MPPLFELVVVAPDHEVYRGQVQSVVAPGIAGSFGVLAHHAPMIAQLGAGEFAVVEEDGKRRYFAISGGFLEVTRDGVTVTADAAEAAEEIDVARAHAAEARARQRLAGDSSVDQARAEAALRRALNRLHVAERTG